MNQQIRDRISSFVDSALRRLEAARRGEDVWSVNPRLRLIEARAKLAGLLETIRGDASDEEIEYALGGLDSLRDLLCGAIGERRALAVPSPR